VVSLIEQVGRENAALVLQAIVDEHYRPYQTVTA
jgi:hypothetical protein